MLLFTELTEELMDLIVEEKGQRGALYALNTPKGPCCACCTCCNCWFWC